MIRRNVKLLYALWIVAIFIVVLLTYNYQGEFTEFYGIAETREIIINSERGVEVRKIHVTAGHHITKGELMVELEDPELTRTINEISHQLEEIRTQKTVEAEALRAEMDALKAEKAAKISEISFKIKQLQAQFAINKELTADLKSMADISLKEDYSENGKSPILIEIESLKKALELEANPLQVRIDQIERELNTPENPLTIQAESLDRELTLLLGEKNSLYIFAPVTGIVASVRCKTGERIAPFTPILTLHHKTPGYIKGFIHEYVYTKVSVGKKVKVNSLSDPENSVIGEVVGVGSRIIEYPRRLRRMLEVQVYGREVRIKIPEKNKFLLGEKVLITTVDDSIDQPKGTEGNNLVIAKTLAAPASKQADEKSIFPHITDIQISKSLKDTAHIEASAALYLGDLKKYLIVSDDTKKNRPILYLMDEDGIISSEVVIQGIKKIADMEAITCDENNKIYIACSQHTKRDGTPPDKKKLLVRMTRDGTVLMIDGKLLLYDLLLEAAKDDKNDGWEQIITDRKDQSTMRINIEGIFYNRGDLYLGLKKPLKGKEAIIVRIKNIDQAFDENRLEDGSVELWKTFDLADRTSGVPAGISDLYFHENSLYILSCVTVKEADKKKRSGSLHVYDSEGDSLTWLRHFDGLKPEGITCNSDTGEFLITFDLGRGNPSKITKLPFSRLKETP